MFGRREELRAGFSKLLKLPNPHLRGKEFEKMLADLMHVEGCEVRAPRDRPQSFEKAATK